MIPSTNALKYIKNNNVSLKPAPNQQERKELYASTLDQSVKERTALAADNRIKAIKLPVVVKKDSNAKFYSEQQKTKEASATTPTTKAVTSVTSVSSKHFVPITLNSRANQGQARSYFSLRTPITKRSDLEPMTQDEAGRYLFLKAVSSENDHLFCKLILKYPDFANMRDVNGNTLLMLVLKNPNTVNMKVVELLLKQMNPVALNAYNKLGTVLHQECYKPAPDINIIRLLLAKGADPTLVDRFNFSAMEYPKLSIEILDLMQDYANDRFKIGETSILPTLEELAKQYQNKELAHNMSWAAQAVRFTKRETALGANNQGRNVVKTGRWVEVVFNRMHDKFIDYYNREKPTAEVAATVKSELVHHNRCGDCFYQSSVAFKFLEGSRIQNVEYYFMDGGSHHFIVIGRNPKTPNDNPKLWNPETVICDPWLNESFPASQFYANREIRVYNMGTPKPYFFL